MCVPMTHASLRFAATGQANASCVNGLGNGIDRTPTSPALYALLPQRSQQFLWPTFCPGKRRRGNGSARPFSSNSWHCAAFASRMDPGLLQQSRCARREVNDARDAVEFDREGKRRRHWRPSHGGVKKCRASREGGGAACVGRQILGGIPPLSGRMTNWHIKDITPKAWASQQRTASLQAAA